MNDLQRLHKELADLEQEEARLYGLISNDIEAVRAKIRVVEKRLARTLIDQALKDGDRGELLVTLPMLANYLDVGELRAQQILYVKKLSDFVEKDAKGVRGIRLKHIEGYLKTPRRRGGRALNPDAVKVIEALWEIPGMTIARLAAAANISTSTAHRLKNAFAEGRDPYASSDENDAGKGEPDPETSEIPLL